MKIGSTPLFVRGPLLVVALFFLGVQANFVLDNRSDQLVYFGDGTLFFLDAGRMSMCPVLIDRLVRGWEVPR